MDSKETQTHVPSITEEVPQQHPSVINAPPDMENEYIAVELKTYIALKQERLALEQERLALEQDIYECRKLDLLLQKSEVEDTPQIFWMPCDKDGIPVMSAIDQYKEDHIKLEQKKLASKQKISISEERDLLVRKSEVDGAPQIFWMPFDKDGIPVMSKSAVESMWLTEIEEKDMEIINSQGHTTK